MLLLSGDIPSQLVSVSFMSFDIVWRWVFESCLVELVLLLDSFSEFRITISFVVILVFFHTS